MKEWMNEQLFSNSSEQIKKSADNIMKVPTDLCKEADGQEIQPSHQ